MFAQGLLRHIEFPAQAGMNRYVEPIAAAVSRVPRASGDEPNPQQTASVNQREFPAQAGMNR